MAVLQSRVCTAMVIDIREFTAMLQREGRAGEAEKTRFLNFLERFYSECISACEVTGLSAATDRL